MQELSTLWEYLKIVNKQVKEVCIGFRLFSYIIIIIIIIINGSTALYSALASISVSYSCTQSVRLQTGISPSLGRYLYTERHKQKLNTHSHPCLVSNSNPRHHCLSERKQFAP
jgi:hypothetical protein